MPTQIVQADRFIDGGGDPNQIDQQPWDASVKAVARYPEVLKWMDENLNRTTEVGQAFLNQEQEVMDSIQRLRASAQSFGNLTSTPQQQVVVDSGQIEILPTDPHVIYVPVYSPDFVYYQSGFGTPFISFGVGFAIGGWLDCDFDWHHHNLIRWGRDHPRPGNWWHERPGQRATMITSHTTVWHPASRQGFTTSNRGDRGWNNAVVHSKAPVVTPQQPRSPLPPNRAGIQISRPAAVPQNRAATAPVQRSAPASRPAASGAFIGIQSSQATRTYSNRGQQSLQSIPHSAPVSRPAPTPSYNGGGNRGFDSNQKR